MSVDGGEQERIGDQSKEVTEITFEHAVVEETKHEFLRGRRDDYGEDDDHDPLLDGLRGIEELDDALLARTAPEKLLQNNVAQRNQRVSKKKQDCSSRDRSWSAKFGDPGESFDVSTAQGQKRRDKDDDSNRCQHTDN